MAGQERVRRGMSRRERGGGGGERETMGRRKENCLTNVNKRS